MRAWPIVALMAIAVAGLFAAVALQDAAQPAGDPGAPAEDGRFDEMLGRIDLLTARLEEVERQLAHRRPPRLPDEGSRPTAGAPRPAPQGGESTDSARFLTRYVASFENGGKGSDFFRLAVEAHAAGLADELGALVADETRPAALRAQLASILGAHAFLRDGAVINNLLTALEGNPPSAVGQAVLASIAKIGDAATADRLDQNAWRLESVGIRVQAYGVMASLAGPDLNATLLRLLRQEESDAGRSALVRAVRGSDGASALAVVREAARMGPSIRNRAAEKLGGIATDEARLFLKEWLRTEREASVIGRLKAAHKSDASKGRYHAMRVTGPADVPNPASDNANAWCPRQQNGGREWLELTYATALRVTSVRVFEVYTAGAVIEVQVRAEDGAWTSVWSGEDPLDAPGVFEVPVQPTSFAVKQVKIVFDTSLRSGWHEIDAVEIVGRDGRGWAKTARASTTWGQ